MPFAGVLRESFIVKIDRIVGLLRCRSISASVVNGIYNRRDREHFKSIRGTRYAKPKRIGVVALRYRCGCCAV